MSLLFIFSFFLKILKIIFEGPPAGHTGVFLAFRFPYCVFSVHIQHLRRSCQSKSIRIAIIGREISSLVVNVAYMGKRKSAVNESAHRTCVSPSGLWRHTSLQGDSQVRPYWYAGFPSHVGHITDKYLNF